MIFTNKWKKIFIHLTQFFSTYLYLLVIYVPLYTLFSNNHKNKFGGKLFYTYLSESGQLNFDFYVNQHRLCWFADDRWKEYNERLLDKLFTLIRDFKLAELNII